MLLANGQMLQPVHAAASQFLHQLNAVFCRALSRAEPKSVKTATVFRDPTSKIDNHIAVLGRRAEALDLELLNVGAFVDEHSNRHIK